MIELPGVAGALTLAGIAFDPHIRGVLVVLAGVAVLMGSVYLLLYTNLGSRLGFLLAAGGFFASIAILFLTWWIMPPAIGPGGSPPEWRPIEVVFGDPSAAATEEVSDLPNLCWSTPSRDCQQLSDDTTLADRVLAESPDLTEEVGTDATLSEIAVIEDAALREFDFGGWRVVNNAEAGEAQTDAGDTLIQQGIFSDPTEYIVLDTFEIGGKPQREDDDVVSRVLHTISSAARVTHPTRYAVVQVQAVIPATPVPGEAPPPPELDTDAPVISVVMIRDLGNLRVPNALVTIGSTIMLALIAYALHRRDQLADEHRAQAPAGEG